MKRTLIALVGAGLLAAAVVAPAGAQEDFIYAPRDCTKPKIEPKSITLACGDANILLKHLGWDEWNTDKVKGRGELWVNDCDPNCAAGTFDKYKVKVRLLNPQSYECGGRELMMYRRAHVRFRGDAPPKPNNFRSFKLFCDS